MFQHYIFINDNSNTPVHLFFTIVWSFQDFCVFSVKHIEFFFIVN